MRSITVYVSEEMYQKIAHRATMMNGKRASMNAVINAALISYLATNEIREEDPPTTPSSEPTSKPVSERTSKNPFSFDDL